MDTLSTSAVVDCVTMITLLGDERGNDWYFCYYITNLHAPLLIADNSCHVTGKQYAFSYSRFLSHFRGHSWMLSNKV